MSVYRFTICHHNWLMLYSHAIIVYLGCCIPNLHLIMRTYYPIVLPIYLVWYTFHFVLLQIHFKAVFNLLFFFTCLLFVRILSIRILFIRIIFIYILFIRMLFICTLSSVYFSFVNFPYLYFSFAYFSFV